MKSLLIGNGLDIQVGGDDYLNKWIIVRLLAKAKMGKYDNLFNNIISGDDIITVFNGLLDTANKARNKKYDEMISQCKIPELSNDLRNTLDDFIRNHEFEVNSIEEIGMEDWILLFLLYLMEEKDLLDGYDAMKYGYQQMLLDSIFCEGKIQKLHGKLGKKAMNFFCDFDSIFTLNYDNMIEKATRRTVYHLHGDFNTLHMEINPKNAMGYYNRKIKKKKIKTEWKHCYSTAILDFSGNLKYKFATHNTTLYNTFKAAKQHIQKEKVLKEKYISTIPNELKEIYEIGIEKDLPLGHNYYFDKFEKLSGELTIIGLAPENDNHIFECINKSDIDHVKFYYYFGTSDETEIFEKSNKIKLNINKSYEILNIQKLWEEYEITSPDKKSHKITDKQLQLVNTLDFSTPITREEILQQINSIPSTTSEIIVEMLNLELEKYRNLPQNEKELLNTLKSFGEPFKIATLSLQALYFLYFDSLKNK